jgi:hypothetical protein
MASPSRTAEREAERRFNIRTLVIASAASATAALVTSRLWIAGTWVAAAMTPVLVALVSELLHRPTDKIAERFTTDRPALAERAGPAPPPDREADRLPERTPREPGSAAPVRVYRSSQAPRRRRKIALGAVFGTAAVALVIAVAALTVPELIAGSSIGSSDDRTTFFSGKKRNTDDREQAPTQTEQQRPDETDESQQPTETEEQPPEEQPTTEEPAPQQTTPAVPQTETAPAPTAPAPAPTEP